MNSNTAKPKVAPRDSRKSRPNGGFRRIGKGLSRSNPRVMFLGSVEF